MKRMGLALLASVVLGGAIAMTGCGGGGSDSPTASITDVSGTWTGTATTEETGTLSTYFVLTQSGTSVSGTWEVYAVSGSIDGNNLHLTMSAFVEEGVTFTGDVQGVVSGTAISGTMSVTGTKGGVSVTVNGTFTVTRSGSRAHVDGGLVQTIIRGMAD